MSTEKNRAILRATHERQTHDLLVQLRRNGIEIFCPLTATYLKAEGTLEKEVRSFLSRHTPSSFLEEYGMAFLEFLMVGNDRFIRSLAAFERAMIRVQSGETTEFDVEWPCDPRPVLGTLRNGGRVVVGAKGTATFHTLVSQAYRDGYIVTSSDWRPDTIPPGPKRLVTPSE